MKNSSAKRQKFDYLFVINPISGGRDKKEFIDMMNHLCMKDEIAYEVYETTGQNDEKKITEYIQASKPKVVVAAGGDGTCNLVAKSLLASGIPASLGIVPLGSANGLATELGISSEPEEAIKVLLTGKEKRLDALHINDKYLCLHLSDLGLNAKVIEEFEKEDGDSRGMLGYFKHLISELVNMEPKTFQIETSRKKFTLDAHMIAIANASKYGTGAILNPKGRIGDGKFEICIIKPFPAIAIVPITIKFFNGNLEESEFVEIFSCKKVKIINKGKAALQIDGEIIGNPAEVTAQIHPNAFRVLVPAS